MLSLSPERNSTVYTPYTPRIELESIERDWQAFFDTIEASAHASYELVEHRRDQLRLHARARFTKLARISGDSTISCIAALRTALEAENGSGTDIDLAQVEREAEELKLEFEEALGDEVEAHLDNIEEAFNEASEQASKALKRLIEELATRRRELVVPVQVSRDRGIIHAREGQKVEAAADDYDVDV